MVAVIGVFANWILRPIGKVEPILPSAVADLLLSYLMSVVLATLIVLFLSLFGIVAVFGYQGFPLMPLLGLGVLAIAWLMRWTTNTPPLL